MSSHVETLLTSCREIESNLVASLPEHVQHLTSSGRPIPADLVQLLEDFGRLLGELDEVVRGGESDPRSATFAGLGGEWERRAELDRANAVLDHLLVLRHSRVEDFGPLADLRSDVGSLRDRLVDASYRRERVAELAEPTHPWHALATLTGLFGEPGDADWERAHAIVGEHLGDELATAAARGKLHADKAEVFPEHEPPLERPAEAGSPPDEPPERELETESHALASRLRSQEAIERRDHERLALVLLAERRPGVAHGWMAVRDVLEPDPNRLPTWLLRALAIAPRLSCPDGVVAGDLLKTFERADGTRLVRMSAERPGGRAIDLLLRAATLRATLVAPESGAGRLLRSTRIRPGLEELHNLCSAIAEFAERTGGLGRSGAPNDESTARADAVAGDVRAWFKATADRMARYARATPLHLTRHWSVRLPESHTTGGLDEWRESTEVLSAVHDVLVPAMENDVTRWVDVEDGARALARRFPTGSRWSDLVNAAVHRASNWTREARGENGRPRASEADTALLRQSLQRYESVPQRLRSIRDAETTFEERVAATLLLEEVESTLSLLTTPDRSTDPESDPQSVLNGEPSLLTGVNLGQEGHPTDASPDEYAGRLLNILAEGPPDWTAIVADVVDRADWETAERMLEFDSLSTEMLEQLESVLSQRVGERRSALLAEWARVADRLSTGRGTDEDVHFDRVRSELQRLHDLITVSMDLDGVAAELETLSVTSSRLPESGDESDIAMDQSVDGEPRRGEGWILDLFDDDDSFGAGA